MNEGTRILVGQLLLECKSRQWEQCQFLCVDSRDDQKGLIVVATTERAAEALLELLDEQKARGIVQSVHERYPNGE